MPDGPEVVKRAGLILGIILIATGVILLAYFASPVRMLVQALEPHKMNLLPPMLGGISLACGIALLFAVRTKP
jgi:hypothetical protein